MESKSRQTAPDYIKYGTFALGLALLAFMLGIFSTGATWATVSDNSSSTEEDELFGDGTLPLMSH